MLDVYLVVICLCLLACSWPVYCTAIGIPWRAYTRLSANLNLCGNLGFERGILRCSVEEGERDARRYRGGVVPCRHRAFKAKYGRHLGVPYKVLNRKNSDTHQIKGLQDRKFHFRFRKRD